MDAFDDIVRRYQDRLFNFCLRYTGNPADAEEIVQETFLKAYRALKRFRGDSKFSTWLFQISKNLCINRFHRKRRRMENRHVSIQETNDDQSPVYQLESDDPSPQDNVLQNELNEQLAQAISELDSHYRAALVLRDVEGLDYSEISSILKVPVGTVKSRIHRGRTELQKILAPVLDGQL